jgi:hypothetical protein
MVVGAALWASPFAHATDAAQAPDRSEVVLVLDFSASILEDETNRNRFATALDQIADRIDATTADLVAGDATVSIVQFAARAADYPGCVELKLINSPANVAALATCLRNVADAYRAGLTSATTQRIGIDTNYVAAMRQAADHLPPDAVRPAMILFTDGKHDVAGVPVGQVQPELERLFGDRSPFALLPVGMGLIPAERDALLQGLEALRVIRDMPACVSGAVFAWPQVVFESPAEAGNAVAVALQNVTCTFTVAPSPTPVPSPTATPEPTPGPVQSARLVPGNGSIEVDWRAPVRLPEAVVDYRVRCRTGDGEWIEVDDGRSTDTAVTVTGLTNGREYECEVAADSADAPGEWHAIAMRATPFGPPTSPAKPIVRALNGAVEIEVPEDSVAPDSDLRFECSPDEGNTWPAGVVTTPENRPALVPDLVNGTTYVCRAFASTSSGVSDPSPLSDAVRPCGSIFECSPVMVGVLSGVGLVAFAGLLGALLLLYRMRARGYVVAVVDVVHTANLGYGSRLGIGFTRSESQREVTDIRADRSRRAEIKVRTLGNDRFEVTDRRGHQVAKAGEPIVVVDAQGIRHSVTLRGFKPGSASSSAREA